MGESTTGWDSTRREVAGLIVLESVDSTNLYCTSQAAPLAAYTLVVSENQTNGRGRRGRSWDTKPGQSVALSIVVPVSPDSHDGAGWIPLVAGAALVEALRSHGLEAASLKWPNDVVVGDAKLAGILCEVVDRVGTVVGIGINVDYPVQDPPHPRATALTHHVADDPGLLDRVVASCIRTIRGWVESQEPASATRARGLVAPVMSTLGREVRVEEDGRESWLGVARGLGDAGELLVEPPGAGPIVSLVASDIEHLSQ